MKVQLKNVRLTFPALFEPKSIKGSAPKFSAAFLFGKDHPAKAVLLTAIVTVAKEKWADKADEVLKSLKAGDKMCVHDGDAKSEYEGYAGNLFVNASSDTRPMVIDEAKTPLTVADGKPYSGCYVNGVVDVWAQSNEFGKRVNARLLGVQFVADGPRLAGGASASADDFEAIETISGAEGVGIGQPASGAASLF